MKKALLLAAAGVVLVSDFGVLVLSRHNRRAAPGGTVELTEREARLPPTTGDSTAILLQLRWEVPCSHPETPGVPDWLDATKLAALGFDCREPITSPHAKEHYAALAMTPLPCYLVLEFEGEAWQRAARDGRGGSRLFVVDAGTDPTRLREKYSDARRHIITKGLVRLRLWDRAAKTGRPLPEPRLTGRITDILPSTIFVARPHSKTLQDLRRRGGQPREDALPPPRFAVSVSWGTAYEPWVQGVRLLTSPVSGEKER